MIDSVRASLNEFVRKVEHEYGLLRQRHLYAADNPKVLSDEQKQQWEDDGYLILPHFFCQEGLNRINRLIDSLWEGNHFASSQVVSDVFIQTEKETRLRLSDAPAEARNSPYKLNDVFLECKELLSVILDPRVVDVMTELLGGAPLVCNTLNTEHGTQQPFHTDSLYMTPPKKLNLAASWLALEDVKENSGPLQYYPGSHQIPPYVFSNGSISAVDEEMHAYVKYMESEIEKRDLKPKKFHANAGDLFVWHSQLYHGGAPIIDRSLTRKSLVTHYFRAKDMAGPHGKWGNGFYQLRGHQKV
jgi:ectoine hydroxylase-related dioxygenase (phytanoyl-CoA dioxygenase family)